MPVESKGCFAVIQYCPDFDRQESVNLGIVVVDLDRRLVKTKVSKNRRNMQRLSGLLFHTDMVRYQVDSAQRELEAALAKRPSPETIVEIGSRWVNEVRLTAPRTVFVRDVESDVEGLFSRLVDTSPGRRERTEKAVFRLQRFFEERDLYELVETKPVVRLEGAAIGPLEFDFGFQNGTYHVIKAKTFDRSGERDVSEQALQMVGTAKLVREHRDSGKGPLSLDVVASFSNEQKEQETRFKKVLSEEGVRAYSFDELPRLEEAIYAA